MSEHNYTYHDDSFSLDKTEGYTLLIQVESNTFSYAISNKGHLIAWSENHPLDELSDPQELLDLLSARYHQVIIGLPAQNFTLIPKDLATVERIPHIARFLDVKAGNKVLAQALDDDNVIVYNAPGTAVDAAEEFGLRNTVFTSTGWLTAIAQNNPGSNDLYLNVENNRVEICYFAPGKLRFYNAFDFTGDDELVYYAALVAGELNLDARLTTLHLSGDVDENDSKFNRLAAFFGKAEVNTLKVLQLPKEIVPHRVLSIASLSLCASSEVA